MKSRVYALLAALLTCGCMMDMGQDVPVSEPGQWLPPEAAVEEEISPEAVLPSNRPGLTQCDGVPIGTRCSTEPYGTPAYCCSRWGERLHCISATEMTGVCSW